MCLVLVFAPEGPEIIAHGFSRGWETKEDEKPCKGDTFGCRPRHAPSWDLPGRIGAGVETLERKVYRPFQGSS